MNRTQTGTRTVRQTRSQIWTRPRTRNTERETEGDMDMDTDMGNDTMATLTMSHENPELPYNISAIKKKTSKLKNDLQNDIFCGY
jgi:hypothetical protein